MLKKIAGRAIDIGVTGAAGFLGQAIGETIGYGLKMKLFPEFREAEIESAKRSIAEADYYRTMEEEEKKRSKKKKKKGGES